MARNSSVFSNNYDAALFLPTNSPTHDLPHKGSRTSAKTSEHERSLHAARDLPT